MAIPKWTKKELEEKGKQGYKVVPCASEQEALEVKQVLKDNKRCAREGYVVNQEGKDIFFVLTKERGAKGE